MALSTDTLECNAARAPWSTDTRPVQGGSHAASLCARACELKAHDRAGNARGARRSRSPEPLDRLDREDGRRSLPIMMVVILALHRRHRACVTRRRSAVVAGDAAVRRGPEARLRRPAARAAAWAHRVVSAGDHAGKGGARSPSELSAAKGLLCVFALARPTWCKAKRLFSPDTRRRTPRRRPVRRITRVLRRSKKPNGTFRRTPRRRTLE
jgi:hypothetical protein